MDTILFTVDAILFASGNFAKSCDYLFSKIIRNAQLCNKIRVHSRYYANQQTPCTTGAAGAEIKNVTIAVRTKDTRTVSMLIILLLISGTEPVQKQTTNAPHIKGQDAQHHHDRIQLITAIYVQVAVVDS